MAMKLSGKVSPLVSTGVSDFSYFNFRVATRELAIRELAIRELAIRDFAAFFFFFTVSSTTYNPHRALLIPSCKLDRTSTQNHKP
jgi:hypothetical protein